MEARCTRVKNPCGSVTESVIVTGEVAGSCVSSRNEAECCAPSTVGDVLAMDEAVADEVESVVALAGTPGRRAAHASAPIDA